MSDTVISVENLSKCYKVFNSHRTRLLHYISPKKHSPSDEVWALRDVNFEIKRGEAVAIIGRNGGGKSTLLQILTGTLTPTTGVVKIRGRVSALLELGSGFNPEYTGRHNVILNGLLLGLSRHQINSRFPEIEAFAEIGAAIDRPVKTYSSGMLMRLAFAVQVLCEPEILIIDEALSVGDIFFQQKCMSYISNLCKKGVTLLFVSHDMGAVREVCNRGIFLNKGYIGFDGSNLESIRYYLNAVSINSETSQKMVEDIQTGDSEDQYAIENPFWALDRHSKEATYDKIAYIASVGIFDSEEMPIVSTKMGASIKLRVHFKAKYESRFHIHVVIKNKFDQVITAFGTHNLQFPLLELGIGEEKLFEFEVEMAIEAGQYVLCFSLTQPTADGLSGTVIDETPWLGPFNVNWNYTEEVPPFFGLAGMNYSGRLLSRSHGVQGIE